jgi:putative transposase
MIRRQYQTYLKVAGEWCYLYRAIDRDDNLIDVYLSETRDMAAAKAFLRSARSVTQVEPEQVTTDGHTSYPRAIADELGTDVDHLSMANEEVWSIRKLGATGQLNGPI